MSKIDRDPAEYDDLIREQLSFIRTSARLFDEGEVSEAKRLATSLRVLLHSSGRNSHALLELGGYFSSLRFYDSAGGINHRNLAAQDLLTFARMTIGEGGRNQAEYRPVLDDGPPSASYSPGQQAAALARGEKLPRRPGQHLPVDEWWNAPVIRDSTGHDFSRADLVKALANEDGGAHVDPGLRAAHHALSRSNSLGWYFSHADGDKALGSPIPASVRQIAHEVLRTIGRQLAHLAR